jgi:hypothetical protein
MLLSQIRPNLTNKFSDLYYHYNFIEFRYCLYISRASPDDGLSGPKHVSEIIKTFISVTENLSIFTLGCHNCR